MNDSNWDRFPAACDVRCVEMKDQLADRVSRETRNASPDELVSYFRDASRHFWQEMGRAYPPGSEAASAAGEKTPRIQE